MASDRPVVLVTSTFRGPGLERLRKVADVVLDPWIEHQPLRIFDGPQLAARVKSTGATILVVESDFVFGDEIMDAGLIAIGSCRGDPTNVDVAAATERGIPVFNAPGRNADGVAEIAIALTLAATRWVIPADHDLRQGEVFRDGSIPYQRFRAWELKDATVGIVGLGAVGRAAAWRFTGLGAEVMSYDPFNPDATHDSLDEMLAVAEVVSMHAAVTPETYGMMNAERFAAMRRGSVYVNSARAGLHDLDALTEALESGHLSAAALDHFDGERLPPEHPLLTMDNVVLTPHIGGATHNTEFNHTAMVADDIISLLAGERPAHCVNPEVLP